MNQLQFCVTAYIILAADLALTKYKNGLPIDFLFLFIFTAENINNGGVLSLSPPHTVSQRETGTQVSQCYSGPPSPCGSKSATSSPTTSPAPPPGSATVDPNWQATKPTVRERNAAMFNNQLMSDITFIVGGSGELGFLA